MEFNQDLLEDEEQLQEQLDAIPSIARCKYAEFGQELTTIIDPLFKQFQSLLSSPNESLSLIEGFFLFALFFYLIFFIFIYKFYRKISLDYLYNRISDQRTINSILDGIY